MNKEDIIIDNLMEMQKSIGGFEAQIQDLRTDIINIENTLNDSFVIPISNRIIYIFVVFVSAILGVNELGMM